ncbi:MAG TPA: EAL domain-containing protein [Candidatus Limnocylindria bacterium]|nr:EAL domain-containing protein [Candidatus Limnocylindria bacterium]
MRPLARPLVDRSQLERAINRARWAGAALALGLAPLFPNLGPVWVAGLVAVIAASALVVPRLRWPRLGHAIDTGVVVYAMVLFSPDHEWTVGFIGVLLVIGAAFRFGRSGAFASAITLSLAYLAIAAYRDVAMGYAMEPQRIGFGASVYLMTALLMGGILWELQALRDQKEEQTERYEALLRAQSDLGQVVILSEDGRVAYVNEAFAELVGRPIADIDDVRSLYDIVAPEAREAFREKVETNIRSGRSITLDAPVVRPDHERRYLEVALKPFGTSAQARLVVLARDVTDRTYAENALEHQALHDILTGLPNRTLLHDRLEHAILDARRRQETLALLILDLDDFKVVNDSFGHHVGDALLTQVGPRFQAELREADTVARLGGDEFAIVLPGTDRSSAGRIAAALLHALERPFTVENEALLIGASIGIAVYPEHGDAASTLMQKADIAMYAAKAEFGNGYAVYAPEHDQHGENRLALLTDLRNAIAQNDLVLEFQPQVSLRTGRVTAVEALVRWHHATRGIIAPTNFVPFAERTGLIKPLTEWVLAEALRQAKTWRAAGHDAPVAVNLSTRNLLDPLFPAHVATVLGELDVPASALRFEITESVLLAEPEQAMLVLGELRALGVQLALDDFGTGYSSLSYLNRLPLHEVKIDRSFVQGLCSSDASSSTIVQATVDLGHRLGFAVVAEGVETQCEWDRLVELGCDIVQGYHIARPMPAADIVRWLTTLGRLDPSAASAAD